MRVMLALPRGPLLVLLDGLAIGGAVEYPPLDVRAGGVDERVLAAADVLDLIQPLLYAAIHQLEVIEYLPAHSVRMRVIRPWRELQSMRDSWVLLF